MDYALEARSQRIRHHLRRPLAGRGDLLNENRRNTVTEIVPHPAPPQKRRTHTRHAFEPETTTTFVSDPNPTQLAKPVLNTKTNPREPGRVNRKAT